MVACCVCVVASNVALFVRPEGNNSLTDPTRPRTRLPLTHRPPIIATCRKNISNYDKKSLTFNNERCSITATGTRKEGGHSDEISQE